MMTEQMGTATCLAQHLVPLISTGPGLPGLPVKGPSPLRETRSELGCCVRPVPTGGGEPCSSPHPTPGPFQTYHFLVFPGVLAARNQKLELEDSGLRVSQAQPVPVAQSVVVCWALALGGSCEI